ncbi:hypothetical protein FPOAC1_007538 [Fusarium poae]|uniref:hypothetical protein n=1 Tax=Fusarium poae TaxID=36050 RepID=UPI001CEA1074|nr:hypothetical protein FPOAC1_007538 [Fusarium poae]KAG8668163.1 hypothetical protein FPOAC1_007538 [Fusarium poae]
MSSSVRNVVPFPSLQVHIQCSISYDHCLSCTDPNHQLFGSEVVHPRVAHIRWSIIRHRHSSVSVIGRIRRSQSSGTFVEFSRRESPPVSVVDQSKCNFGRHNGRYMSSSRAAVCEMSMSDPDNR